MCTQARLLPVERMVPILHHRLEGTRQTEDTSRSRTCSIRGKKPPKQRKPNGRTFSIHEILKFRRALAHLDEEDCLFGDAFGSTATRDDCISNCHRVDYRLIQLAQKQHDSGADPSACGRTQVLPFEVLEALCIEKDTQGRRV